MAEFFSALIGFFIAVIHVVVEVLAYLVAGSVTIIAYCLAKSYRKRKDAEWKDHKFRKRLQLGFSSFCLASLMAFVGWGVIEIYGAKKNESAGEQRQGPEESRFGLQVRATDGKGGDFKVTVREGGLHKIIGSHNLQDFEKQLKENMTVTSGETNGTTNHFVKFEIGTGR